MARILIFFLIALVFNTTQKINAQGEAKNWYFGSLAGITFTTNPPGLLNYYTMNANEGCASVSDALGSLLFYTNGATVWNSQNVVMANGTGLLGGFSSSQAAIIVKQPGNTNIYYIFTSDDANLPDGIMYSIVDMSLAGGQGSVTASNIPLYTPSVEKLVAVKHSNNTDFWIISHEWNTNNFRAYLLTAAGVNPVPVITSIGTIHNLTAYWCGYLKASPNGKKLGMAMSVLSPSISASGFELFDFNRATGVVSNSLSLGNINYAYGCEFSPDGTKFYGGQWLSATSIFQWDLCAGSNTAIIASQYTVTSSSSDKGALQLAPDGKIYVSRNNQQALGIINNPNSAGVNCNYTDVGFSIAPKTCRYGLPNFIGSEAVPSPVTFSANLNNCNSVAFTSSVSGNINLIGWNFGDPPSGPANTSTLSNPTHIFSGPGSYSVQLIFASCNGIPDTLIKVIIPSVSNIVIDGLQNICKGASATLFASGANSYTWSNNATTQSISVSPSVTTVYTVVGTNTAGCQSSQTFTVYVSECTGLNSFDNNHLKIFPNPVNEILNITNQIFSNVIIYDLNGIEIMNYDLHTGDNILNVKKLEKGIYTLKLSSNINVKLLKLVKLAAD